ncbi:MAG: hypothetical protein K2Q45_02365 [Nitrosomonas sp.]|nr:hypothetical protein [Nitrosomonas sp.]
MKEVEQLSKNIQLVIDQCFFEKQLLQNKYGIDPETVMLESCTSKFKYYGNHHETFRVLSKRFEGRAKVFELGIELYPEEDDDYLYTGTTFFWERSTIKIIA